MKLPSINLDQSKHSLVDVIARQKADPEIVKVVFVFLEELQKSIFKTGGKVSFKTHKFGISSFYSARSAFAYLDFHISHASIKFWTGRSSIHGLENGNWSPNQVNQGSQTFHIDDSDTAEQALSYAIDSYYIAINQK